MTTLIARSGWDVPSQESTAPWGVLGSTLPRVIDWSLGSWISIPAVKYRAAPDAQIQAIQLVDWTGLSLRALADLLGTTHPTLGALVSGRSTELSKKPHVLQNLSTLHGLVERLVPIAPDARTLADCLTQPSYSFDGRPIALLAVSDSPAAAYMAALRVLRPRQASTLKPRFASRAEGTATVALSD